MWRSGTFSLKRLVISTLGELCLDLMSMTWSLLYHLPFYYFDVSQLADGTDESVYSLLRDNMVCGKSVSASVHHIFYFCFASLCFHFDFLSQALHPKNKLLALHFFNHIPTYAKDAATVEYHWNKTEAIPTLISLSPHITIQANFEQLKIEKPALKSENTIS